jgi:hypothetical protein
MPYSTTAERKNPREKEGHHSGGIAVTSPWVLKAVDTNQRKGAREKPIASKRPTAKPPL